MLDLFNDVPAFVAAAEAGNFAAAGRKIHLSRSAVGKAVARIEERLGVRLFHRTTRAQILTEEGQAFLLRCNRAMSELREGAAVLEAKQGSVRGLLRVTMPMLYGRSKVAPVLMRMADRYPALTIELDLRDRHVSLVEDGFDLAVRSGPIGAVAGLSSRLLDRYAAVLCAAPSVVARIGMPRSLADLVRYGALVYRRDGWTEPWLFPNEVGLMEMIEPQARIHAADLGTLLDAAEAGRGVAWLPDWLVEDALATGRLIRLLPDLPARQHPIHLLWATSAVIPARVQVAIDALKNAR